MRSSLNQDVLFDIGKKLIEEGDQEAVIRFGLSGREPLKALCKVFASVTTLELYNDHYAVGWDDKLCNFYFAKPHFRSLMKAIGGAVTKLRMDYNKEASMRFYRNLLKKIADKQQLTSICVPSLYDYIKTWAFIQTFSFTLEHLEIDAFLMAPSLRDSLNLKSLTILNPKDMYLFQHIPKASTMILKNVDGTSTVKNFGDSFFNFFNNDKLQPSPFLKTIKELVFNDKNEAINNGFEFQNLQENNFSSLESITFKIK